MEARLCCFVLALQIVCLVFGTSRPFAPDDNVGVNQLSGQKAQSVQVPLDSKQGIKSMRGVGVAGLNEEEEEEEAYSKGLSKIGSSPPSCEHKCFGCTPCEAIQVPTTSKNHNHFGVNYANYEPEGWKCKCGPTLYSP
ncbi:hypothetical protein JCGZ_24747 [Jatropha curcas]|uniref:Epidermal patterning factor-like protein n=1 Tax=Jatropha curcas TaxID=180498 RepID=A0A067L0M5_JATCU|nr:EPIDERMAL PATTERNING FACTOR-like protein 5 [Jatropha curcas]KDP40748.1 hypothetical protein JCGZ_24747 [Jatropha curcas]